VNKTELVEAVAGKTDMKKSEVSKAVDAVFDAIANALTIGDEVRLVGFGTFSVASQTVSERRTLRTRERLTISGSISIEPRQVTRVEHETRAPGRRKRRMTGMPVEGGTPSVVTATHALPTRVASKEKPSNEDLNAALEAARSRGRTRVATILGGKDMLSAEEFGKLIGVSRVTVNQKRQRREVLALEGAKRGYRFPEWQIGADGKPFDALPELFDRLGRSPWEVYRFLVQHHPELGGLTGVEALRRGRTTDVIDAAESTIMAPS